VVNTQAEKEYVLEINEETALKPDVGKTISGLQNDLQTVMKSIMTAKRAVMDAARALAQVLGVEKPTSTLFPTATPTLTVTPTPTL